MNSFAQGRTKANCLPISSRCLLLAILMLSSIAAHSADILLLKSLSNAEIDRVEYVLRKELVKSCQEHDLCYSLETVPIDQIQPQQVKNYRLIISLGNAAAQKARHFDPQIPQLLTLVSIRDYSDVGMATNRVSILPFEQPLARQLDFIRYLLPDRRRIGILLSADSNDQQPTLQRLAQQRGLDLYIDEVKHKNDIGKALYQLTKKIDLLLAIPDPFIYNRNTLSNILLTTYHQQVPVIGFSAGGVKSGMLAALHLSPQHIGREAADRAIALLRGDDLTHQSSSFPNVSVNRQVARALHLVLPSDDQIAERWGGQSGQTHEIF